MKHSWFSADWWLVIGAAGWWAVGGALALPSAAAAAPHPPADSAAPSVAGEVIDANVPTIYRLPQVSSRDPTAPGFITQPPAHHIATTTELTPQLLPAIRRG